MKRIANIASLTATTTAIYDTAHTPEGAKAAAKIRKLAAKSECSFEDALLADLIKQIKFGAIEINRKWYPVVNSEVQYYGYTHSSGALSDAAFMAGQHGVTLKV